MAERNIVGGMFGMTPEMYQRSVAARDTATNAQLAALAPGQLAGFYAMEAGSGLGRATQGLLGVEDPQLAMIRDVQQMRSQFDVSTPQGLRQFAQALGQRGYTDLAIQATARAADIDKDIAIAEDRREAKVKQVGLSEDGRQVYQSGTEQFILGPQGKIPYFGKLETRKSTTEVNLGALGEFFAKNQAKEESKDVVAALGKAKDLLGTGAKLSRDIDVIDQLLPNSFQGQFANWSKTASKTLSGLGIPVSEKASNTETLNALFTNFVLPAVKQLPGSLAAKELDFLRQSKPETLQEPATIRRLVGMLKEDIAVNRALVKRADSYQRADKLNSLQGFNIALEQDNIYTDLRRYNALKQKVQNKQPITKEEADFAKAVEKELGL